MVAPGRARWLIFLPEIPPKPDYLRVKVRRRLHRIGALALKNAVYLLPLTPEAREDFQWLRREIRALGGQATLCQGEFVEGANDEALEREFRRAREAEYARLVEAVRAIRGVPSEGEVGRFRRQLREINSRDYFRAANRDRAERSVAALARRALGPPPGREARTGEGEMKPELGAVWVTRQGIFVDRIASAWLIARFIDPAASFKFVEPEGYRPRRGERRFDMFEGEFTHEGDRCTFETLLGRFRLDDPALATIAEIVHDIDCKDAKFGREETEGIRTVLEGLAAANPSDEARLAAGRILFDGLYERFRRGA